MLKLNSIFYLSREIFHKLDLVVDSRVILELKAVSEIAAVHKQQALAYLKATRLQLAMVINFGAHRLQVARVVNTRPGKIAFQQVPPNLGINEPK